MRALDADRRARLTRSQQGYQELVEYYTVWAHQIKTPIAAMRLLLQDADTDEQRALLEQLQSVHVTNPEVRAIIDIGGQDVKGISIDTDGTVKSFAMNDKCSAGTGRFFEAMARSFEMSLPEFSNLSLTAKNVIPITAQCTVFAESEVITLVGEGKPTDEIAAGIEMAVAKRCFVMAKKAGATDSITLTGGCAKNAGLKQAIEHVLKFKVVELKTDPQLMGALGAAEYARQKGLAKK